MPCLTSARRRTVIHLFPRHVRRLTGNCSIGPMLFLLYIYDMPQKVSSTARMSHDDSLLYLKISSTADTIALQRDMDRLQQWEEDWQMSFNPRKCEVIRLTKRRNLVETTYQIHGHDLSITKTGKYPRVINQRTSHGSHMWMRLRRRQTTVWPSFAGTLQVALRMLKHSATQPWSISPIFEYAVSAWDPHTIQCIKQLETVHCRAARLIKGDYRKNEQHLPDDKGPWLATSPTLNLQ